MAVVAANAAKVHSYWLRVLINNVMPIMFLTLIARPNMSHESPRSPTPNVWNARAYIRASS